MKRFFFSIRFQLIFVLLFFVTSTFFVISTNISTYLKDNEIVKQTDRLTIIAKQIEDRYEKMYTAESLLRGYESLPKKQRDIYINVFLKPAVDNYFSTVATVYQDIEFGYYIPIFTNSFKLFNETEPLIKKIVVVDAIPEKYGGGYIFASVPQTIIEQNIESIILKVNRFVFYIALITFALILLITSFFSIRVLQLRRGLKELEKNLDFRFPNYGGEIGDISQSINTMAEHLKRNIEEMQKAEALKSLGMFTAGIVHEIRNPLTSIKGFATMLSQKLEGKEEEKLVKPILLETQRLQRIAEDLLKYGRPTPLTLSKFNLKPFFDHIIEMGKQYAKDSKINFELNCSDLYIMADERKLEELFLNLVINAIQAIDKEVGEIRINCFDNKDFVKIEVIDNGAGIDESAIKNIFVPFYTTKSTGTGLGLAIVHRIVEEHGGEIMVESKKGEWTKFTVILPKRV